MRSFLRFLSIVCIVFGVASLLFATSLLFARNNPNRLAFNTIPQLVEQMQDSGEFSSLSINNVGINLSIETTKIENNKWQISNNGISYLSGSALPGQIGNSIFYGHNWNSILGNLINTKPGDIVIVNYKDGSKKDFVVRYTYEVSPKDTSILSQSDERMLTIYTCSGLFDTKRFVAVAFAV